MKREKNKAEGNISHVRGNVSIGDHTHIHPAGPSCPKELTLSLPRIDPNEIIGREQDLAQLHQNLHSLKKVVLVNGLGGIGKTTLAQAYVSEFYQYYKHIAWVAQSSDTIANDFVNTAGLVISLGIEAGGKDSSRLFTEIIMKLKAIGDQPNLLIIDNAEQSLQQFHNVLPLQPQWHVLVTSREVIPDFHMQRLGFLDEGQALALFKKHYPYQGLSDADIKELVASVDNHTLTIEILAKTAAVQRYDLAALQEAIRADARANIKVAHNQGTVEKIGTYLRMVFTLSRLNGEEIWVLKQFTCLPAEFHTYQLLRELVIGAESPHAAFFAETLSRLAQKGWLLQDTTRDSYKMHRIIAGVIREEQPASEEDIKYLLDAVSEKLKFDFTKDNPIKKFVWIPYGKALLSDIRDDGSRDISLLRNSVALRLRDMGDYQGAQALLTKFVAYSEKFLGPDHPDTAVGYSNLALVLKDLGDFQGAKELLEKAIEYDEKNLGAEHSSTAIRYSNLALVLRDMRDFQGAKELLEKAVKSDEKNFGPDHRSTSISYSNLALVLKDLGDYQGAKELLEKVIRSDEKNLGTDHPATAISYSNLALVLQELGDYQGAKELLEKAIQSDEKNFGTDHRSTAIRYSNMARLLQDMGDYKEALGYSGKAVKIVKKVLPEGHPLVKTVNDIYQSIQDYPLPP